MKISQAILSAAVSGMALGLSQAAWATPQENEVLSGFDGQAGSQLDMDAGAKHACKGQNACKGQGGCKSDKHACKGQNACKGQGGCRTDGKK
jgi:hypothetical protein